MVGGGGGRRTGERENGRTGERSGAARAGERKGGRWGGGTQADGRRLWAAGLGADLEGGQRSWLLRAVSSCGEGRRKAQMGKVQSSNRAEASAERARGWRCFGWMALGT